MLHLNVISFYKSERCCSLFITLTCNFVQIWKVCLYRVRKETVKQDRLKLGCTSFPNNLGATSRFLVPETWHEKRVPHGGLTNIRCNITKFSYHCDLAPKILCISGIEDYVFVKCLCLLAPFFWDIALCRGYLVHDISKEHSFVTVKGRLVHSSWSLGSDEPVTQHCVP